MIAQNVLRRDVRKDIREDLLRPSQLRRRTAALGERSRTERLAQTRLGRWIAGVLNRRHEAYSIPS
jgi:hypothetical protein